MGHDMKNMIIVIGNIENWILKFSAVELIGAYAAAAVSFHNWYESFKALK